MSNKNLTNNQLLLKEIISQEYEDNNQFASLDTFFELFSAGQILKDYAFSNEEIESALQAEEMMAVVILPTFS